MIQVALSVMEGRRPEVPAGAPKEYVDLMVQCWDANPTKRPVCLFCSLVLRNGIPIYHRISTIFGPD
jgi:hypothetical protein